MDSTINGHNNFTGEYKGVKFRYASHTEEDDGNGLLIINLRNGVESTHIIKDWGPIRVFQYIASFVNIV